MFKKSVRGDNMKSFCAVVRRPAARRRWAAKFAIQLTIATAFGLGTVTTISSVHGHGGGHTSGSRQRSASKEKASDSFRQAVEPVDLQSNPLRPRFGGQVTTGKRHYFEVVYLPNEIRLFVYGPSHIQYNARRVEGDAILEVKSSGQRFRYPLEVVVGPKWTDDLGYLAAKVDLTRVRDGDMLVAFNLENLPEPDEHTAHFVQTFALTRPPRFAATYTSEADRQAVQTQRLCPVMDTPLGGHGTPIKVTVEGQSLFVCCQGCIGAVAENPPLYFRKTQSLSNPSYRDAPNSARFSVQPANVRREFVR